MLVVADTVKPTSAEAVELLKMLGLETVLPTGDNDTTARVIARIGEAARAEMRRRRRGLLHGVGLMDLASRGRVRFCHQWYNRMRWLIKDRMQLPAQVGEPRRFA